MVVVDNARKMISKTIDIVVTSVLQTTAGKMIFGRYLDPTTTPVAAPRQTATPASSSSVQPAVAPASIVAAPAKDS
jgi:hypothetical protein